ncbi:MAG: TonB-dependent receptor [Xanthomonadaceae bacterium]|nr:TonB-dependent receptor [Xanthomonadaceae bacterium]
MQALSRNRLTMAVNLSLLLVPGFAAAQDNPPTPTPVTTTEAKTLDRIEVTGSRIKQTNAVTSQPVAIISRAQIDASGATSIGEFLQDLTASGKALNAKFNSSGNFGYPASGGGIGAGSSQVDLRNLGSQRVLVLVDGIRWVNESSASGVSGSADLNTIPLAIVERIEVLEDGASAIYGSDAIAGVVNIITRKKFDGALVHVKAGSYGHGGDDREGDITVGGSNDHMTSVFSASYVRQDGISSADWGQSSFPVPGAGIGAGSSATPQGRFTFCDPRIVVPGTPGYCDAAGNDWFDITLNNGVTTPNYNGGDPTGAGGTYHNWVGGVDRFNFAPYNLLLTPSTRKSLFGSVTLDIGESASFHAKALYNNRRSTNQAAPEPIFVGPFAGTGGIADTIVVAANNPYNPFGIDLDPATNFGWITKRPLELGPRIFSQNVDTSYINLGFKGSFGAGNGLDWNVDYVHTSNRAEQTFSNGFNVRHLQLALGDVNVCNATPGCVPLDLFGGQARPMTPAMLNYIVADQHDSSRQGLDLLNANLTGDLWQIGNDRHAGFAIGYEHRRYQGDFNPDVLRQTGESQDSFAAPVSSSYSVNEAYAELLVPWLSTFSTDFAVRRSQYSTFGGATTGKAGFRWQPIEDLVLRGTWSQGFRAPNLGELYGLTQFAATLTDPCGTTGTPGPAGPQYVAGCAAQGIPTTFEQANTQIITFTGGNPDLQPEKSDNYSLGGVYSPSWAENQSWASKLDFEVNYFHYKVKDAIQAPDIQNILNQCTAGTLSGAACSGFTRGAGFNLNPPTDFLANLGTIVTSGVDLKANWIGPQMGWGQPSVGLQATRTIKYDDGSQRAVGIEVNDSAIPDWQTNVQLGWRLGDWNASWNVRYISAVDEFCSNSAATPSTGCATAAGTHTLGSTVYNDAQLAWNHSMGIDGLKLAIGANNIFNKSPPVCVSCSLNGYDAGTYDLPFRFWYVSADFRF